MCTRSFSNPVTEDQTISNAHMMESVEISDKSISVQSDFVFVRQKGSVKDILSPTTNKEIIKHRTNQKDILASSDLSGLNEIRFPQLLLKVSNRNRNI